MGNVVRFFFSSRRRHTRWPRDWSSDVCSSDLGLVEDEHGRGVDECRRQRDLLRHAGGVVDDEHVGGLLQVQRGEQRGARSEERRVGKEGKRQWQRDENRKTRGSETKREVEVKS